jgi:PST family polysaccharide transporter
MLTLLSVLGVARPLGWTISSYLLARNSPRLDAGLEVVKLLSVVALLLTLGRLGPLWSCVAVGLAFVIHSLASMMVVQALDGISIASLAAKCGPPLAACVPMVAGIVATEQVLSRARACPSAVVLVVQIVVGALVYVTSALLMARAASQDLLGVLRHTLRARVADDTKAVFTLRQ